MKVHYPTYETLLEYATGGCSIKTGRNWTKEEIHTAVMKDPHESALEDEAITNFATEAKVKVASNRARLVLCDKIKGNIPTQIEV